MTRHLPLRIGLAGVMLAAAALLFAECADAQQPSAADIAGTLVGPSGGRTRGLPTPKEMEQRTFMQGLATRSVRGITIEELNQVTEIVKDKPSVDLEINFDYNSAAIGAAAIDSLNRLGTALRDPRLKGALVLIAGHTDAKGGDDFNKDLSNRRADAAKQFLVEKFTLPAENLVAVGYGKERLKNTADPFAAENRRVQVVNLSAQ